MGQCLINRQLNINVAPVIDIYNHNKSHGMFAKNSKYNQINQKITERKSERTLKNQWDYFRYLVTRDYRKYSLSGLMKAFPFFHLVSCYLSEDHEPFIRPFKTPTQNAHHFSSNYFSNRKKT